MIMKNLGGNLVMTSFSGWREQKRGREERRGIREDWRDKMETDEANAGKVKTRQNTDRMAIKSSPYCL